jgi:protein-S-isoprenylcysteine O-methyltransferase Ste14
VSTQSFPLIEPIEAEPTAEATSRSLLARIAMLAYGLLAYAAFFVTFLYAIGFVGNFVVPKSIDSGTASPVIPALLINGSILALFVVQHTIMARPAFKRWWTRIIPAPIERSTFVLLTSAILMLLFWQWRPLPQAIWHIEHPAARTVLISLSLTGWAIALLSSFMVSHFDLFGVRQVWMSLRNRRYQPIGFRLVGLYKLVRHPLMVGFLIAFWCTPDMTLGHLFFASMTTAYIFLGTAIEERDLEGHLGESYHAYQRRVRGFVPIPKRVEV